MNNDPNSIRNIIINAVNTAIDNRFEQIIAELREENSALKDDNQIIRNVVMEQQKTLERMCSMCKERTQNNVFITGIPTTLQGENMKLTSLMFQC